MACYTCENCGDFFDDDYEPGTEYGSELICQGCVETILSEVDDAINEVKRDYERLTDLENQNDEEKLEWARNNL